MKSVFPKKVQSFTPEEYKYNEDWQEYFHTCTLKKNFDVFRKFNNSFPSRYALKKSGNILEIGGGIGDHFEYEKFPPETRYYLCDLRQNMIDICKSNHPEIISFKGNIEAGLDFPDNFFDKIIAIHVLEHLPNLPATLKECRRLLNKNNPDALAIFVLPCEGTLVYSFCRYFTVRRLFENRYHYPYHKVIKKEHINTIGEIIHEIKECFIIKDLIRFPFKFLPTSMNLLMGLSCRPRF